LQGRYGGDYFPKKRPTDGACQQTVLRITLAHRRSEMRIKQKKLKEKIWTYEGEVKINMVFYREIS
jgi:hypothetical protein